jgi:hypothetical protein
LKTYVVQTPNKRFVGNAESPEEVVLYAIARESMIADTYVVYDYDLNRFEVSYASLRPQEITSQS